jgi:hypothetical protein
MANKALTVWTAHVMVLLASPLSYCTKTRHDKYTNRVNYLYIPGTRILALKIDLCVMVWFLFVENGKSSASRH